MNMASAPAQPTTSTPKGSAIEPQLGTVVAVRGGVVDVRFAPGQLPAIHNALEVLWDEPLPLVLEVEAALDECTVRTVALQETQGFARHAPVRDTGAPLAVPVGEALLGRLIDVLGRPGDGLGRLRLTHLGG